MRAKALVVVSWVPVVSDAGAGASRQIELEAPDLTAGSQADRALWTDRDGRWVSVLAASNCQEVVLTARVGESEPERHWVLELAGLLTRELERTKPLIRVRFLPRAERTSLRSHRPRR